MKNGTETDKTLMQEGVLKASERNSDGEMKKIVDIRTDEYIKTQTNTS